MTKKTEPSYKRLVTQGKEFLVGREVKWEKCEETSGRNEVVGIYRKLGEDDDIFSAAQEMTEEHVLLTSSVSDRRFVTFFVEFKDGTTAIIRTSEYIATPFKSVSRSLTRG